MRASQTIGASTMVAIVKRRATDSSVGKPAAPVEARTAYQVVPQINAQLRYASTMAGMTALHDRTSRPLPTGTPALSADDTARLLEELGNGWSVFENRLRKSYTFSNFATALAFVNKV